MFRRINEEYRFLLIKNRRSNNWGFPKGHIEKGETEVATAKREVLEETGRERPPKAEGDLMCPTEVRGDLSGHHPRPSTSLSQTESVGRGLVN